MLQAFTRLVRSFKEGGALYTANRLYIALRNRIADRLGYWAWRDAKIDRDVETMDLTKISSLLDPNAMRGLNALVTEDPTLAAKILDRADKILARDFAVLGYDLPKEGPWPWATDWTCGYVWPKVSTSKIDLYESREQPYDIKRPFELSRLFFLPQVALAAGLSDGPQRERYFGFLEDTLQDWLRENPTNGSVAWYSFEASVRTVFVFQTLALLQAVDGPTPVIRLLLKIALRCQHFVHLNPDKAVSPNNHYIGNLACHILVAGLLKDTAMFSNRYRSKVKRAYQAQILRQFHEDGGHFEGSLHYHVATLELCLFSELALSRTGQTLSTAARDRLTQAMSFSATVCDDRCIFPHFGDSDDGRYLVLDLSETRQCANLLALKDQSFVPPKADQRLSAVVFWGQRSKNAQTPLNLPLVYHPITGAVISRQKHFFFYQDVGSIGFLGRGSHGHNDLSSFVLQMRGTKLIDDRGTSSYSTELESRNVPRKGTAHSILMLDDQDIAEIGKNAFLAINPAEPIARSSSVQGNTVMSFVSHNGFRKLYPSLIINRKIDIDLDRDEFLCRDWPNETKAQLYKRRFHLGFEPVSQDFLSTNALVITDPENIHWSFSWDPTGTAELQKVPHFETYGKASTGICLTLENTNFNDTMWFKICPKT